MKRLFTKSLMFSLSLMAALAAGQGVTGGGASAADGTLTVEPRRLEDRKAVFATVEAADVQAARTRIGGTVGALSVDEGDAVTEGQTLAVVGDPKLALQLHSVEARIQSLQAERAQAQTDLNRTQQLYSQGVMAKARLDQARTAVEVLERTIASVRAERQVIEQQSVEGQVLAPRQGRVLDVLVTDGAVVLPGEPVATIATGRYILRMEVPERHARFIDEGDRVLVGPRGLDRADMTEGGEGMRDGIVVKVYPKLKDGRVVADIEVPELGDYFVGERAVVYVSTGARDAFVVPPEYLATRYGVTYATLQDGSAVVVQPGNPVDGGVEVLSGLREGDVLVKP